MIPGKVPCLGVKGQEFGLEFEVGVSQDLGGWGQGFRMKAKARGLGFGTEGCRLQTLEFQDQDWGLKGGV